MTRRNKPPATPPAPPAPPEPPLAPPFTYWTLADALRELPDLVVSMHGVRLDQHWPVGSWRSVAQHIFSNDVASDLELAAAQWALLLHPATEMQITRAMRRLKVRWFNEDAEELKKACKNRHHRELTELFLQWSYEPSARKPLAKLLNVSAYRAY